MPGLVGHRRARQDGSSVVEAVVVVPALMVLILLTVQAVLWAEAAWVVQAAAGAGQRASSLTGSVGPGQAAADQVVAGSGTLTSPAVQVAIGSGDVVEVQVRATATSVMPWMHFQVSAQRNGPVQEFRAAPRTGSFSGRQAGLRRPVR
ncbi:MAG: hypothetical protein IVW52_20955 [Acidimicrobiales bacterium]|nr:hypothetical protein [Acidimicrobiales bacterium]